MISLYFVVCSYYATINYNSLILSIILILHNYIITYYHSITTYLRCFNVFPQVIIIIQIIGIISTHNINNYKRNIVGWYSMVPVIFVVDCTGKSKNSWIPTTTRIRNNEYCIVISCNHEDNNIIRIIKIIYKHESK